MAEKQNPTPETVESEVEKKQSSLKNFTEKHPRAAKVVGITAGVAAVAGVVVAVKSAKSTTSDLDAVDALETFEISGTEASTAPEA